jgi:hypothetical protein
MHLMESRDSQYPCVKLPSSFPHWSSFNADDKWVQMIKLLFMYCFLFPFDPISTSAPYSRTQSAYVPLSLYQTKF